MNKQHVTPIAIVSYIALLAGCSSLPDADKSPDVPDALKVPETQTLSLATNATGVQIYECKPSKTDPSKFEWEFKAPEAELFDKTSKKVAKHYGGPTWESPDGSKVVGEIKARSDSPNPDAIAWLLLSAKSTSGTGIFSQTLSIHRLNTRGGKAPAEGCSQVTANKEVRVPYSAEYYFYAAKS